MSGHAPWAATTVHAPEKASKEAQWTAVGGQWRRETGHSTPVQRVSGRSVALVSADKVSVGGRLRGL